MSSITSSASEPGSPVSSDGSNAAWDQLDRSEADSLYSGLDHVNLLVPPHTLHLAYDFYAGTLGLTPTAVPPSSKGHLAWFKIGNSSQQIHITSQHPLNSTQMKAQTESPRHFCFKIPSQEKLDLLHGRIWQHYERGGEGAPVHSDDPAQSNRVSQGAAGEFPNRFFARDYAGNRLEFSL
ncbi:hypothetical protein H2198_005739 [Neophaeococcomyces mojaviensis]|uniref:Uncharacterized protein n=1 Tax=Neophaeococcomyces mojaviensis TaxID=3383035 RepID=A0ACC3A4U2_9EURO|nr:hypothetical protein H2198_005739 [Knufia sp. JES_112]